MDERTRCRAMVGFAADAQEWPGENRAFWLAEAERWASLLAKLEADVVIDLQERGNARKQMRKLIDDDQQRLTFGLLKLFSKKSPAKLPG
jgi:hypothetical protein